MCLVLRRERLCEMAEFFHADALLLFTDQNVVSLMSLVEMLSYEVTVLSPRFSLVRR